MMMQKSQTFLGRLVKPTFQSVRGFSTAGSIQARFEQAYLDRTAALAKTTVKQYVSSFLKQFPPFGPDFSNLRL